MTRFEKVNESFALRAGDLFCRRLLAMIIDYGLLFGVLVAADGLLGNELYQKTIWVWSIPCIAYYPLLEGCFSATLGKKLMRLKVVNEALQPCGCWRAIIRFLIRPFDANLIGLIAFCRSIKRRRLGDMAAGTLVVRAEDLKDDGAAVPPPLPLLG